MARGVTGTGLTSIVTHADLDVDRSSHFYTHALRIQIRFVSNMSVPLQRVERVLQHLRPQPTAGVSSDSIYDVLIVGVGAMGVSTAYHLAKAGKKVSQGAEEMGVGWCCCTSHTPCDDLTIDAHLTHTPHSLSLSGGRSRAFPFITRVR